MTSRIDISPISRLLMRIDAAADGARPPEAIASGFPSLDELLGGGLRRGDLVTLAGDVGVGKSALALAIALRVRAGGHQVVFLTGEMTPDRVLERALAIEGRARVEDLRRGTVDEDTRAAIGAAALRMREQSPVVDRLPTGSTSEIEVLLNGFAGTELVVVDSLQCLATGAAAHHDEIAAAAVALKAIAMDRNVAMLVTAHLVERTGPRDARPTLDDLGGRGQVKQLSDIVLGLYREELYDTTRGNEGATELLVLKNRSGATSYADLYFYREWLRFEDMVEPHR